MKHHRTERVAATLRAELDRAIKHQFEPPLGTLVTIEEVFVPADLSMAKVFVSVYPFAERDGVVKRLTKMTGPLWREVANRLKMQSLPKFVFVPDDREEKIDRVNQILDKEGKEE